MIKRINLNQVASYKQPVTLETDKKVNLTYGLNGTGKSTLSNFLYDRTSEEYKDCSIDIEDDVEILVYNQQFTKDNFDEDKSLPGVFSLAKENKAAKEKIRDAEKSIDTLLKEKEVILQNKSSLENELSPLLINSQEATFKIKKDYSGGDRVLDYCLERLKNKAPLFNHLLSLEKPKDEPSRSVTTIKKEIQDITGSDDNKHDFLPVVKNGFSAIEKSELFKKQIVGDANSTISDLIDHLDNSDWVKLGKKYIDEEVEEIEACPFCQEKTITTQFKKNLKDFFNEAYETDLQNLTDLQSQYSELINAIPNANAYENNQFVTERIDEFQLKYNTVIEHLKNNQRIIDQKISSPGLSVDLIDSHNVIKTFNDYILSLNAIIEEFNDKIDNKTHSLRLLKDEFWRLMRWNYDQTISNYNSQNDKVSNAIAGEQTKLDSFESRLSAQRAIVAGEQKNTISIEEAAESIKAQLVDLGITDFTLKKESETSYRIVRGDDHQNIFRSLSEGEKMLISFLYFLEVCKGKTSIADTVGKKVIVIDDPISSLSHVHIFNISKLIQKLIFKPILKPDNTSFQQVHVLTHSLYFFYELAEKDHEKRDENQKLVRLIKNEGGSYFEEMKYTSIQNDYQAYWSIIKDKDQHPAIVANCMRNIVEHFFSFTEKFSLADLFSKQEYEGTKYQAFHRYMNRESHSDSQNIFDFKEFDYSVFLEAFKQLFNESGYSKHYKRMMK